jgi:hypothetical protein
MNSRKLVIDCSPEQLDVIEDHLLYGKDLGVLPDERAWMLSKARQKFPTCKIVSADLDIAEGEWVLNLSVT